MRAAKAIRRFFRRACQGALWCLNPTTPAGKQLVLTLLLTFIFRVALFTFAGVRISSIVFEIFNNLAVLLSTNAVILMARFWVLQKPLTALFKINDEARAVPKPAREAFVSFATQRLNEAGRILAALQGEGPILNIDTVNALAFVFFESSHTQYSGVDTHPPGEFMTMYEQFLIAQKKGFSQARDRNRQQARGTRVLAVDLGRLGLDYKIHRDEFEKFLTWHEDPDNFAELRQIDAAGALKLAKKYGLSTCDVGVWEGGFALHFSEPEDLSSVGKKRLTLHVAEDSSIREELSSKYADSVKYVRDVIKESEPLDIEVVRSEAQHCAVTTFRDIASRWDEYVNCQKRLVREGPFLLDALSKSDSKRVLDAAAGCGCESIFLAKKGFSVVANEIDINLLRIAEKKAEKASIKLPTRNSNWLEIGEMLGAETALPGELFDAVLVLGNSLSMLTSRADIKKSLQEFGSLLHPGGLLIVDERNYEYINKNPKICTDLKRFPYSGEIMYCGESLRGVPENVYHDLVIFNIVETANRDPVKKFLLYPFRRDELRSLLLNSGFESVETYYDFGKQEKKDAEFLTHVAIKR